MKVLFITHYTGIYGANVAMLNMMLDLRERYAVEPFVLLPGYGEIELFLKQKGINYIVLGFIPSKQSRKMSVFKSLMFKIKTPFYYLIIFLWFRNNKFDVIHTNSSVINIGAYLHILFRVPHVWHLREFGEGLDYHLYQNLGSKYERFIFEKGANFFIAISDSVKKYYEGRILQKKILKIYDGVNVNGRVCSSHSNEIINFVCVGCLCPGKNQSQIIEAVHYLKDVFGEKVFRLNIIGNGEIEYENSLREKVKEYGLTDNVLFWGYREDVIDILPNMDVGIISSRSEGFGLVTVEYMLHGLPVLGTSSGATHELVEDGTTGFLFKLDDSVDLAIKMRNLLQDKNKIRNMGRTARDFAEREFTIEKNTDSVYLSYKRCFESI